jgi:hypothetical protein
MCTEFFVFFVYRGIFTTGSSLVGAAIKAPRIRFRVLGLGLGFKTKLGVAIKAPRIRSHHGCLCKCVCV